MISKIITDDTGKEICRSVIRSAIEPSKQNLQEDPIVIPPSDDPLNPTQAPTLAYADTIEEFMSPTG